VNKAELLMRQLVRAGNGARVGGVGGNRPAGRRRHSCCSLDLFCYDCRRRRRRRRRRKRLQQTVSTVSTVTLTH